MVDQGDAAAAMPVPARPAPDPDRRPRLEPPRRALAAARRRRSPSRLVLSPLGGLGFAVVTALPAWWLAYLALLGRPAQPTAPWNGIRSAPPRLDRRHGRADHRGAGDPHRLGRRATRVPDQNARAVSQALRRTCIFRRAAESLDAELREGVVDVPRALIAVPVRSGLHASC